MQSYTFKKTYYQEAVQLVHMLSSYHWKISSGFDQQAQDRQTHCNACLDLTPLDCTVRLETFV